MAEPLPRHFDYQGIERGRAYIRGITSVRCIRCQTTGIDPIANDPTNVCGNIGIDGKDTGIPVCRNCGGYGCVPPTRGQAESADNEQAPIEKSESLT